MDNKVQLITYIDRLSGGGLFDLHKLLNGPLAGLFGGVHLLPFYYPIDGADAGFDPIDHTLVDPRLGTWDEIRELSRDLPIMADLIVNHISADSPQFVDLLAQGSCSPYDGLFLTLAAVFPNGATEQDLLQIYRPRPGLPFIKATLRNGEKRIFWTTFSSKQLDIDVRHPRGDEYLHTILRTLRDAGVTMMRLDAVGYAIKRAGTNCFMIPETYAFIADIASHARAFGIEVLVEIHSYHRDQIEVAKHVGRVYDFALPPLVLHAIFNRTARVLKSWFAISPRNCVTVLDTHDGIGIMDIADDPSNRVARPGLIPPSELEALVNTVHRNSQGQSTQATGTSANNLDIYQVNCTYYDALGRDDDCYLIARAIQFFAPGVPQVYYTGLLAGHNDVGLLVRSGVGRDINRHYYTEPEIQEALKRPVVQSLLRLIRFRNEHPAFGGTFEVSATGDHELRLLWTAGPSWTALEVNFVTMTARILSSRGISEKGGDVSNLTLASFGTAIRSEFPPDFSFCSSVTQ